MDEWEAVVFLDQLIGSVSTIKYPLTTELLKMQNNFSIINRISILVSFRKVVLNLPTIH